MASRRGLRSVATATVMVMTLGISQAMAEESLAAFTGHWRVARVAVPDVGVQALGDDDPSLMGKRLTFTSTQLT